MPRGSKKFTKLKSRLHELRRNLLSFLPYPPISKVSYTDQELDSTRAYIVLAHAEIESYCEELVRNKVDAAKAAFDAGRQVTPVLRRLLAYHVGKNKKSWSEVRSPSLAIVSAAAQGHISTIRQNNGIRRSDLEKLLFPVGVLETGLDTIWLAQMDSFGIRRGGMAHSGVGAVAAPDPLTELTTVNQLLSGLLKLDRALARLK
jgi:hypothetical protein